MSKRSSFRGGRSKALEPYRSKKKPWKHIPPKFDANTRIVGLTITDAYGDKFYYEEVKNSHLGAIAGTGDTDDRAYVQRIGGRVIVTFPARSTGNITVSI